jgi:hypothetical protein
MSGYQEALAARFRELQLESPPAPWRLVASIAIGSFEALGFSPDSRHLLVVSSSGRGVFDSASGQRVSRDSSEPTGDWYDIGALTVEGIGPLAGQSVRVAGIHGGGLPRVTLDGWVVDVHSPRWPASFVTLSPPGRNPWVEEESGGVTKVAPTGGDDAIKCFGFSWSRGHLVVATGDTLDLFLR